MALYDGPIIDAHHHLWPYQRGRHGWLEAGSEGGDKELPMGDVGTLRRDVLPEDYLREADGQGIVATVHVEGGWQGGPAGEETDWLDTLDRSVVAARHVFHVDLAAPDAAARLDRESVHPCAAGVRDILAWHPDKSRTFVPDSGKIDGLAWRQGLALLARTGLACELMIFPWQMAAVARLLDDFAEVPFVLEHCGSPVDRSEGGMAAWADGLADLAKRPNLTIKVSNPFAYDHQWTMDSLRSVVGHCIDLFGPERSMFGSDYPVAGLHASFPAMMDAYRALTADLSPAEQRAFFHDTAARIYRIDAQEADA